MRAAERDDVRGVKELVDQRVRLIELGDADPVGHDSFRVERVPHDGGVGIGLDLRKQPALDVEVQADAEEHDALVRAVLLVLGALVQDVQGDLDRCLRVDLDARLVVARDDAGGVRDQRDLGRAFGVVQLVVEREQAAVVDVEAHPEEHVPKELVGGR